MKDLKFVFIDISVSFLRPFSKYKKMYMLYYTMVVKTFSVVKNIKTLKHCENLFRASNEIKQYIKNATVKSHELL